MWTFVGIYLAHYNSDLSMQAEQKKWRLEQVYARPYKRVDTDVILFFYGILQLVRFL